MTAQTPDTVILKRRKYELCGVNGDGLFEPADLGIEAIAPHTACWRGFVSTYSVRRKKLHLASIEIWCDPDSLKQSKIHELFETIEGDPELGYVVAKQLEAPVPFSGGLLIGRDFIPELYVHMGFHPGYKFREVIELKFDRGHLERTTDRSEDMAEIRRHLANGEGPESRDLVSWIEECFDLGY